MPKAGRYRNAETDEIRLDCHKMLPHKMSVDSCGPTGKRYIFHHSDGAAGRVSAVFLFHQFLCGGGTVESEPALPDLARKQKPDGCGQIPFVPAAVSDRYSVRLCPDAVGQSFFFLPVVS